jgi:hypothetical protein
VVIAGIVWLFDAMLTGLPCHCAKIEAGAITAAIIITALERHNLPIIFFKFVFMISFHFISYPVYSDNLK